jgi:hypothetical protein
MRAMTNSPHVDPDNPPIPAIRELLRAAFTDKELRRFCQDRPALRPSLHSFSDKASLEDMIDAIMSYCRTRLLWDELLSGVAEVNPRQYNRFAARLGQPGDIETDLSVPPAPVPGWHPPPLGLCPLTASHFVLAFSGQSLEVVFG